MKPADAIGMLDRQLADHGEDVVSRNMTGSTVTSSQTVRAFVRDFKPSELIAGIDQGDTKLILSPTGLTSLPKKNDQVVIAGGVPRTVKSVAPILMANTLVRLELAVRGGI